MSMTKLYECIKCRSTDNTLKYIKKNNNQIFYDKFGSELMFPGTDALLVTCDDCEFIWTRPCEDYDERKD